MASSISRNYAIGIILLLSVVLLWTLSSFLVQNLFVIGWDKPFLVTYLKTSTVALYLVPLYAQRYISAPNASTASYALAPTGASASHEEAQPDEPEHKLPPLTTRETAKLAAIFCILWFFANWTNNASLEYTTVGASTILASTSGFWTLAVGRLFGVESLTMNKVVAVCTSFVGVLLVSLPSLSSTPTTASGSHDLPHATFGNLLSLVSSMLYALYVTILKLRTGSEDRLNTQLFFGFVGLYVLLGMWPIGVILHLTGVESMELPPSEGGAWAALLMSMFITWSSNYLYVLALLRTTPLVVTIGLSLTIPFAVFGDFWLGRPAGLRTIIGAALVLASFGIIGRDSGKSEEGPRQAVESKELE